VLGLCKEDAHGHRVARPIGLMAMPPGHGSPVRSQSGSIHGASAIGRGCKGGTVARGERESRWPWGEHGHRV
jgi:hypothetical protein